MARAVRRASTVSASKLATVIDRAARKASVAHKVKLEKDSIIGPGILVGRIVRDKITLKTAETLAADISSGVARSSRSLGISAAKPAVMVLDKRILVGFIDPRQVNLTIR